MNVAKSLGGTRVPVFAFRAGLNLSSLPLSVPLVAVPLRDGNKNKNKNRKEGEGEEEEVWGVGGTAEEELVDDDEAECSIANMIYKGYIKGYISREKAMVVLSAKDPFPKLVR